MPPAVTAPRGPFRPSATAVLKWGYAGLAGLNTATHVHDARSVGVRKDDACKQCSERSVEEHSMHSTFANRGRCRVVHSPFPTPASDDEIPSSHTTSEHEDPPPTYCDRTLMMHPSTYCEILPASQEYDSAINDYGGFCDAFE